MRPPARTNSRYGYMVGTAWRPASSTIRPRWVKKKFSPLTTNAPTPSLTRVAKTDSISPGLLAFKITTRAEDTCRILYIPSFSGGLPGVGRADQHPDPDRVK